MKKEDSKQFTHKELVNIAYRWVLANASCGFAFREFNAVTDTGEQPDVIGFGSWGHSVLIEVKVSRNDFLADKKKKFRLNPETGMGSQRYYCCPTGLIKPDELPEGWGLIYVNEKGRATKVKSLNQGNIYAKKLPCNTQAEMALMYSALRRLHIRGRIDEIYSMPGEEVEIIEVTEDDIEKGS